MASEYFGMNRGAGYELQPYELTVGTSTGSTDMELRIDLTKSLTKKDVSNFLSGLQVAILDGKFDTYIANI